MCLPIYENDAASLVPGAFEKRLLFGFNPAALMNIMLMLF
jgi:hypothetical protein